MLTKKKKMASTKLVFLFIVASFLVFLLPPSHAASHSDFEDIKISSSIDSQMVNLSVYYEALSPSCATFIIQNLTGVFDDDLITITNLRMVPWGNAHVNETDNTIICQVISIFSIFICY
jgi:interferon gamma-inducible protein 30